LGSTKLPKIKFGDVGSGGSRPKGAFKAPLGKPGVVRLESQTARARGHACPGAGDDKEQFPLRHPGVRRLEESVIDLLQELSHNGKFQLRNQMMIRSLAIPVALLRDYGDHTPKGRELIVYEFRQAVRFLLTLNPYIDLDLDYVKFQVSRWFQEAVGDIRADTGHKSLEPSPMVELALEIREHLFAGYLRKLVKRVIFRAQNGNAKAISIAASFLLLKKGWPELSNVKKLESIKDHQAYLSTPVEPISLELKMCVEKTTQQVLGGALPNIYTKMNPSHNASYAASRKRGGAYSEVVEEDYIPPASRPYPSLGARNASGRTARPSLRAILGSISDWKHKVLRNVRDQWRTLIPRIDPAPSIGARNRPAHPNIVRVQCLPEPGKFRNITAGPALLYTTLQGLQGVLLTKWKAQRYSTMNHGWEEQIEKWVIPSGWLWNSGDYKAATDQLNSSSSRAAEQKILSLAGLEGLYTGLLDALIEYPKDLLSEGMSQLVYQKNGQLMGHPLSFPILCIVNLSGLKLALQIGAKLGIITREDATFILHHTKINGDDILFPCPPPFVPTWERTAAELGLKLSIGKSYSSSFFAMVNNVMFRMGPRGGKRIGYVNQSLILNYKIKSGDREDSPMEIGHAFNSMLEHCPVSRPFLSDMIANRRLEPTYGYQPNFFVSTKLGGLGIDPKWTNGQPVRLTLTQRRVAALFAEDVVSSFVWSNGFSVKGPLAKFLKELPAPRLTTAANSEVYEMRYRPLIVDNEVIDPHWDSDPSSYKSWVALLTSMSLSIGERDSKRLNLAKLSSVNPMRREKVLNMKPKWLFPELPEPSTGFVFSYRGRNF
jgi:hypothetical protein